MNLLMKHYMRLNKEEVHGFFLQSKTDQQLVVLESRELLEDFYVYLVKRGCVAGKNLQKKGFQLQ